jgi:hypothetical protein
MSTQLPKLKHSIKSPVLNKLYGGEIILISHEEKRSEAIFSTPFRSTTTLSLTIGSPYSNQMAFKSIEQNSKSSIL